jgi:hypothetical protein
LLGDWQSNRQIEGLVESSLATAQEPKLLTSSGDATFNSKGDGSGFVDRPMSGGAVGSASADVSGSASGQTSAFDPVLDDNGAVPFIGTLTVSGSSASNGEDSFAGGSNPSDSSGPTGGSTSGSGTVSVAGVGQQSPLYLPDFGTAGTAGTTSGTATAQSVAWGSVTGFNNLGSAGGLDRERLKAAQLEAEQVDTPILSLMILLAMRAAQALFQAF